MRGRFALLLLLAIFCGCSSRDNSREATSGHTLAIIGAVLLDGTGAPPLSDSVVIIAGGRIQAAGRRGSIPIPADADKIDGSGRYVVPAPVDVWDRAMPPALSTAQLEAAREAHAPAIAAVSTAAEAEKLVRGGATVLVGMIHDTGSLDPEFVRSLRDLRVIFAPALASSGGAGENAKRNTERLFRAGVPIAVASASGDIYREMDALSAAGIPAIDVIVAATRNGAMALHQLEERGTIEAGKRADLLVLSKNPGEDISNLRGGREMRAGQWVR
jgi:imidazolonepropionase-like amidohydrolase